jgi:hypothetical protein
VESPYLNLNQDGAVNDTSSHVMFAISPALQQGGIHETQKPKYRDFDDYFFDDNHLNAGDEENTVRDPFSKRLA